MADNLRIAIRLSYPYVTDPTGWDSCHRQDGSVPLPYDASAYSASQGFGFTSYANQFRNRNSSNAPQLAGMYFTSTNGHAFRLDLPDGAGTYRVRSAHVDQAAGQTTGWDFKDGSGSTIASVSGATTGTNYRDINSNSKAVSGFSVASETYVEHTFTNDHLTVVRNTSLNSGNGVLSAVWVEKVASSSGGLLPINLSGNTQQLTGGIDG